MEVQRNAGAESGSRMITPWRNLEVWQNKYTKVCVCASAILFTKVVRKLKIAFNLPMHAQDKEKNVISRLEQTFPGNTQIKSHPKPF